MPSQNFTLLSQALAKAQIDFSTVTVKALLINTTVPTEANFDAWQFRSDVTNEHAATGNYVTGGFACTATVNAADTTNNLTGVTIIPTVGNGAAVFTNSTIDSNGAIIYVDTGLATTDRLITFVDFGATISSVNGDFKVTFSDDLNISV